MKMNSYTFIDYDGSFRMEHPEHSSYLYFPIANESIKGSVTPKLGGDLKTGQNTFVLQPVSSEDLHNNRAGRNFWCRVNGKGCYSITGASAEEEAERFLAEENECLLEAGYMWHRLHRSSKKYGLYSEITSFVPYGEESVEIMMVQITNTDEKEISLTPIAAIPIYGRSADNIRDHRHVTSLLHRIETMENGVYVTPTLTFDERGHQKNSLTYYVCGVDEHGEKPLGFYPVVEEYIGEGGSFLSPKAVYLNEPYKIAGMQINGYEAMGGIRFADTVIAPGESRCYIMFLGVHPEKNKIKQYIRNYGSKTKIEQLLNETKEYWKKQQNIHFHTGDEVFDQYMNWVNFQPILRRIYGCSFLPHHDYGKGGRGFRDLWQDCLALLLMNPKNVREMLVNNFAGVRMDGSNATIIGNRMGEFVADRNNITRVWMDHGVWPLITTNFYINQTGDLGILLQDTVYFKDRQIKRGTEVDELWDVTEQPVQKDRNGQLYQGSILEHLLLQALTAFYEVGVHNHIRLRGADWNDALDMAPEHGESVAFTAAYAGNLITLAELLGHMEEKLNVTEVPLAKELQVLLSEQNDDFEDIGSKTGRLSEYLRSCSYQVSGEKVNVKTKLLVSDLRRKAEWIINHIRTTEWLGYGELGWFNGYYDNHKQRVEGIFDGKVRMMLTSQVFTIMSGTATEEQVAQIVKAADSYLYEKNIGGYRLNTDFKEVKDDLGRMFGFAYGHKENGAVFSHMVTMFANALYRRGFVKEAFKALHTLYKQAMNFPVSRIYPGIPEYFNDKGRGMYHYLTGAASWYMLTVVTEMFGVQGRLGDMVFEPKLMKEQFDTENNASVILRFQEKNFRICYSNPEQLEYGEYIIESVKLDGQRKNENRVSKEEIAILSEELCHEIRILLGKR